MELLRFTVRNQNLSGGKVRLVSDSIDYVEASFDFRTDDWSGLSKWAHFTKDDVVYDINLVDDKITKDMHLNLDVGTWEVKLHGTDLEGTTRITTDTAYVTVESYGNAENENPLPEIPLSAAEQIDAKSQNALDTAGEAKATSEEALSIAEQIREAAANGEFDGEDGAPGKTPEIQVGVITTLPPDAQAQFSIEGTAEKPIFNFAIPKGNTGDEGVGIESIMVSESNESGGINDIRIILTDGRGFGWNVKNGIDGVGIESIETESSTEDGGMNHLNIILTNGAGYGWVIRNGKKGAAGRPGLVWQGEWNEETNYSAIKDGQISRDVVSYNGSSYVVAVNSTAPVKGVIPEGDTTGKWALLAKKGDMGSAEDVDARFDAIEEELAALNPFSVTSFTVSPSVLEKGDSASSVLLKWVFNKEPASVMVDGKAQNAVKSGSVTIEEEISAKRTFKLSATDAKGTTVTKDATVNFYSAVQYGTNLQELEKVLTGTRKRTFTVNAAEEEYIYYFCPVALGNCTFKVGGFEGGFDLIATNDMTNDFGYTESYNVYRSAQAGLGETTVEVS